MMEMELRVVMETRKVLMAAEEMMMVEAEEMAKMKAITEREGGGR